MSEPTTMGVGSALTARMNYLVARQGVVASNLANADTPDYKAQDLTFTGALSNARLQLAATQAGHISPASGNNHGTPVASEGIMKNNGNNIDTSVELQKLAEIQLDYRAMTGLFAKYATMQKIALGRAQ